MSGLFNRLAAIVLSSVAVAVMLILISPYVSTKKTPGSFEYIRKGEELFNKGRYKDVIAYFEKAYESSPQNEIIVTDLIFAYSKYSAVLAESRDYVKAIEYLDKARDLRDDENTKQNLAMIYSKQALDMANKANLQGAIDTFANARRAVSGSDRAAGNVSMSILNDAVREYRSGRDKTAILCLKEASLIKETPEALEFLGDIYRKLNRLEKARFYWKKAYNLHPSQDLPRKLEKLDKEIELAARQEARELPHFEIRYESNLPVDLQLARDVLERAYFDIGRDLEYFPKDKTVVFFYSQRNFREIFILPIIVRAFYDGNIRMPLPDKEITKDEFVNYIYHEYTHAVVSAKTNNNCPVWFAEGLAVWEEFRKDDTEITGLISRIKNLPELRVSVLDAAFKSEDGDKENTFIYYLLAYTVVRYIVDNWGLEGLRDLLGRMANGQHIINAIDDEFLISESEFEKRWRDYLEKTFLRSYSRQPANAT